MMQSTSPGRSERWVGLHLRCETAECLAFVVVGIAGPPICPSLTILSEIARLLVGSGGWVFERCKIVETEESCLLSGKSTEQENISGRLFLFGDSISHG